MLVSELAGPELNYWVGRTEGKLSLALAAWFMFDNHTFHRCQLPATKRAGALVGA